MEKEFYFDTIGQLASIGRRSGVAKVFGYKFSGFSAWFLWRAVYLLKLPRWEKRIHVALDWALDLVFSKDTVQFMSFRAPGQAIPTTRASDPAMDTSSSSSQTV